MTPKEQVLKQYPEAESDRDGWCTLFGFFDFAVFIDSAATEPLAIGDTPRQAWESAAKSLRRNSHTGEDVQR